MVINTRTLAEMQAEMSSDEATAWVKLSHWSKPIDSKTTQHLMIKSRTVVRDYMVTWNSNIPTVEDVPAEYSNVGETIKSSDLKAMGWKRHKATTMYNEVTRELATL
jgi:hypothetical protein